jgi:hypothetical protein
VSLQTATIAKTASLGLTPLPSGLLLQRKCAACGTHTPGGGTCTNCAEEDKGLKLQKKLSIGASNDPLEAEADRVADQVLARSPAGGVAHAPLRIQRLSSQADPGGDTAPASVHRTLAGSGTPLESRLRQDMESRFGHDFSGVRVHSDGAAAQSARDVSASAYTVGNNIVFGAGQYAPGSGAGQRLLAHELTHVVQQGAGPDISMVRRVPDKPMSTAAPSDRIVQRNSDDAGPSDAGPGDTVDGTELDEAPSGGATTNTPKLPQSVCSPKGLSRANFLKEPNTSVNEFGMTRLDASGVTVPSVTTAKSGRKVTVQPTTAALPLIPSVYTDAGTFIEGVAMVFGSNPEDCRSKKYPIKWTITPAGADLIKAGEAEHCADFQLAFDISLGRYAAIVNGIAQSGKTFANHNAAERHIRKLAGSASTDWLSIFICLAKKTLARDSHIHTPRPRTDAPTQADGCEFAKSVIHGGSLPEVGKHPSSEFIKDCGEPTSTTQPAVKAGNPATTTPPTDKQVSPP